MASQSPEQASWSLVLVGAFNPSILQPAWLAAQGLVREEEAEAVEIDVIHPELASFKIDWFELQVTRDRFSLTTTPKADSLSSLRDLGVGIFEVLRHSRVRLLGINRLAHYKLGTEEQWHELGHTLVPPDHWQAILERAGMRSLTVEGLRPDDYRGYIRVTVEPSVIVTPNAVFVAVNDHFDLQVDGESVAASRAIDTIRESWDTSLERAEQYTDHVLSLV